VEHRASTKPGGPGTALTAGWAALAVSAAEGPSVAWPAALVPARGPAP